MTKYKLLKKELLSIFKKNPFAYRYFDVSAIAKLLNISWNTSKRLLNELYFDGKVEMLSTPNGEIYSLDLAEAIKKSKGLQLFHPFSRTIIT